MKMNKIVASVSAAALAVSALATSAFAANVYTVDMTHQEAKQYNITLSQTIKSKELPAADAALNTLLMSGDATVTLKNGISHTKKINIKGDVSVKQSIDAKSTDSSKTDTVGANGSADIDVTPKYSATPVGKDTTVKITGGSKLLDSSALAVAKKANTEITIEISFSIPVDNKAEDVADVKSLFAASEAAGINVNGLVDGGSDFADLYADGELTTTDISSILPCTIKLPKTTDGTSEGASALGTPGAADPWSVATDTITIKSWNVAEFEVEEKTVGEQLNNVIDGKPSVIDLKGTRGFTIPALTELKDGGKMTLYFENVPDAGRQFVVRALYVNDGLNIKPVQQEYTVDGKTIEFTIPAGFTLDENGKYGEPTVYLQSVYDWTIDDKWPTLMKVEFTAEGAGDVAEGTTEAVTAPSTNEGDENTNKPATNGDKNQPTGVAIAIVPAIVAAAGVIISKKRK